MINFGCINFCRLCGLPEVQLGEAGIVLFSSPKICLIYAQPIYADKGYGYKKSVLAFLANANYFGS